jgi:hypothetical protein
VSPGNVGLTCMHSFGYGVPVITHDDADEQMPEWEAIVPGVTGDVFRRNSAEDLARVIRQWTKSAFVAESTRERCLQTVTDRYHPRTQRLLIERAVSSHSLA